MPQMAPYNWLYLNMMFTLILIIYLSIMYFISNSMSLEKNNFKPPMTNKFNLKW